MTETGARKDSADVKNCTENKKFGNAPSKPPCKEICNKHDLKLKEAEKTIANKDVIIKMLQGHVKKLEESYKHNLKETEDFRFKFCIASEQVKRLRACPKQKEKREKDKDIKELRCDLVKWKEQCEQMINSKERSTHFPGKYNCVQKIINIEKFMKAHYELLQTLFDKLGEKNSVQLEHSGKDNPEKACKVQIVQLQEEINRLKAENARLHDQFAQETNTFPEIKDSLYNTLKRTTIELQNKVNCLLSQEEMKTDSQSDFDENDNRRVSFLGANIRTQSMEMIREESNASVSEDNSKIVSTDLERSRTSTCSPEKIKEPQGSLFRADKPSNSGLKLDCYCQHRELRTDKSPGSEQMPDCNCQYRDLEVQVEETMILKEISNSQRIVSTTTSGLSRSNNEQISESLTVTETTVFEETSSEGILVVTTAYGNKNENQSSGVKQKETNSMSSQTHAHKANSEGFLVNDDRKDVEVVNDQKDGEKSNVVTTNEKQSDVNKELNDMTQKLNEIRDIISELVEKQSEACKDLELLKKEMAVSRDSTEACTQNISRLNETIEEQRNAVLANFEEYKAVTDNLTQANENVQKEVAELKGKIEELFQNVDQLNKNHREGTPNQSENCPQLKSDISYDLITMEECHREIEQTDEDHLTIQSVGPTLYADDATAVNTQPNPESTSRQSKLSAPANSVEKLEEEYIDLKKESQDKDRKIKCINALLSYYSKASAEVLAMYPKKPDEFEKNVDAHLQGCKCGGDEIHNYIEKVRGENLKLKTTISSVIEHLNDKMSELKSVRDKDASSFCLCFQGNTTNKCDCAQSAQSSTGSNSDNADTHSQLEIEDIYNVVRRTLAPSKDQKHTESYSSCLCNQKVRSSYLCSCNDSSQSIEVNRDDICSILCACDRTESEKSPEMVVLCAPTYESNKSVACSKRENKKSKECVPDTCGGIDQCGANLQASCSGQSLISNLQTYVNYLHEQLAVISSIENRIEDMRGDIKNPPV